MSSTPLPRETKLGWANQEAQLHCLEAFARFQFVTMDWGWIFFLVSPCHSQTPFMEIVFFTFYFLFLRIIIRNNGYKTW